MKIQNILIILSSLSLLAGCGGSFPIREVGNVHPPYTPNYIDSISTARWSNREIHFHISGGSSIVPFVNIPKLTEKAAKVWNKPLEGLATVELSNQPAEIEISYVQPHDLDYYGSNVLGITTLEYTDSSQLILSKAIIQVDRSLVPTVMARVVTHEMGHALGIKGHSPYDPDIMNASGEHSPLIDSITIRDQNTMAFIYSTTLLPINKSEPNQSRVVCILKKR